MFFRRVYEGGTIGIRNGVELYAPVAENEIEERELEARLLLFIFQTVR